MRRLVFAAAAGLAVASAAGGARAADDGVYGRLDGDLDLRLGAGVALAKGGPAFSASTAIVYVETAGLYAHYTDALSEDGRPVRRSIATGVHIQPLFLARYATDGERGPAHLDLFLDSFAIELGAVWHQPGPSGFVAEPGFELGVTMSMPILPQASGPHVDLRGALRWRDDDLHQGSAHPTDVVDRGALFTISLSWHQIVRSHLVDVGDVVRR